MISLQNITKIYNGKTVLHGVSLEVPKAKTVSLIGPSGCGKSTLLRIAMGLIKQDGGTISIDGTEMRKENMLQIRQKMGYVIQKGGLFPHLSARQNCTLVTNYLNWDAKRIEERIEELASLAKIEVKQLDRKPNELSGGQQQRISLIRALMLDPEIIVLDEPLGSIDPLVRYELQTDLKAIFSKLNKTVLLVTHDLGEAAFLGDEIILMKDGSIEQKGSIKQILKEPANEFVERFVNAQRSPLAELEL